MRQIKREREEVKKAMKAKPKAMVSLMIKTRKTNKQTAKANPNNMAAIGARRVRDAKKGVEQRDRETDRERERKRDARGMLL